MVFLHGSRRPEWQSSDMAQPSAAVRKQVDDLIAFVTLSRGVLPRWRSDEPCEASLANAYRDLKSRCNGPIRSGKSPSELKLTPSEVVYFNQIEAARKRSGANVQSMHRGSVQDNAAERRSATAASDQVLQTAEVERQIQEPAIAKDYQGAALVEEISNAPLADVEPELIDPALAASSSVEESVEESASARSSTASDQRRLHKRAAEHLFPVAPSKRVLEILSRAGRACDTEGGIGVQSKCVLLRLKRPHYNAIRDRRKLWEA